MTVGDLFRLLAAAFERAGISYMLVGSYASNVWGVARATQDVDFLIAASPQQIEAFLRQLPDADYYYDLATAVEAAKCSDMFNILEMSSGLKIDLIFRKPTGFSQAEFQRRTQAEVEGVQVYIASAEDVVISKLEWAKLGGSSRQIEDVAGIIKLRGNALDHSHIEKWVHDLGLFSEWDRAQRAAASIN